MVQSASVNELPNARGTYLCRSSSNDVYLNLAREEYLFDHLPDGSLALLLYVDSPSVVFGKHQNPWRECSIAALRERRIPLARRISGGGTVYHDLGNLNFSFILPKEGFDRRGNLAMVVRALQRLGVAARISERHDLLIGDRKISGNAFCFRRSKALHHGTLLVRSRLEELQDSLDGMPDIHTFAVESKRAPVMNISELDSRLEIPAVSAALGEEVQATWGGSIRRIEEEALEVPEVEALSERNRSVEWIFDRTPGFTVVLAVPAAPILRLKLTVDRGRIVADTFPESEGFTARQLTRLSGLLSGLRFDSEAMAEALSRDGEFAHLAEWVRRQGF